MQAKIIIVCTCLRSQKGAEYEITHCVPFHFSSIVSDSMEYNGMYHPRNEAESEHFYVHVIIGMYRVVVVSYQL